MKTKLKYEFKNFKRKMVKKVTDKGMWEALKSVVKVGEKIRTKLST